MEQTVARGGGGLRVHLRLVLTMLFWGGTFVSARWLVQEIPPFRAAFYRFALASALLVPMAARRASREGSPWRPRSAREWRGVAILGATGIFLYNACLLSGLRWTTASNASLIVALNPVLTLILSGILLGERLRLRQGAGFLVSLAGTALVILVSHGAWGTISRGDLLVLGAPVTWAIFTVVGRRVMTGLSPMAATAWSCLAGTLLLAPAAGIEAWLGAPAGSLSLAGWAALLQLVLMGTVAGFVWWYEGVLALGASRAAVYVNLVPVFGVLLSAAILGERLAPLQAVGGVMVLAGVRLVQAGGSPTS